MSYLGWLQPRELAEAYATSDLLLFPSEVETFGNVTLEAMASGLPCIVDERCGAHLVQDDINGYTVRGGDVDLYYQLAWRLCDGVKGAALRKRLGGEARRARHASQHVTIYACVTALVCCHIFTRTASAVPLAPTRSCMAGRAVEHYDVCANTEEIIHHYIMRVGAAQRALDAFSLNAFVFLLTSEVILFGFFWGATLINKVLAATFYLLGV